MKKSEDVAKMRQHIADLYRHTMMTQQEIADELNIAGSAVNTAISMLIPMDERKRLVQKRRKAARIRELVKVCPHCGEPLD